MSVTDEGGDSPKTTDTTRSRGWVFTINNWTPSEKDEILAQEGQCNYLSIGEEGRTDGKTPHLQGFISYKQSKSFKQMKQLNPRACWLVQKGSDYQAAKYTWKEGTFVERGRKPLAPKDKGSQEKEKWKKILALADEGKFSEIDEFAPKVSLLYDKALLRRYKKNRPVPKARTTLDDEWWYGDTGTNKTRTALREHPDAYIKDPETKWWDDYDDEEVVIIDDFDKYQKSMGGMIKRWTDHNAFKAEVKYGYVFIRPKKIIFTSNYHPKQIWEDSETILPLLRRLKVVRFRKMIGPEQPPLLSSHVASFNPAN